MLLNRFNNTKLFKNITTLLVFYVLSYETLLRLIWVYNVCQWLSWRRMIVKLLSKTNWAAIQMIHARRWQHHLSNLYQMALLIITPCFSLRLTLLHSVWPKFLRVLGNLRAIATGWSKRSVIQDINIKLVIANWKSYCFLHPVLKTYKWAAHTKWKFFMTYVN